MDKSKEHVIGFNFQEIPLKEAMSLVVAGSGLYGDLISRLLETAQRLENENQALPHEDQKAFAFSVPGGKELPDRTRRGILAPINKAFRKSQIDWKVRYSQSRKLFILVPLDDRGSRGPYAKHESVRDVPKETLQKLVALNNQGVSKREMADAVGLSLATVQNIVYKAHRNLFKLKAPLLDKSTIKTIVEMRKQGYKIQEIAAKFGISPTTVKRYGRGLNNELSAVHDQSTQKRLRQGKS